jgi:hypothetical protein
MSLNGSTARVLRKTSKLSSKTHTFNSPGAPSDFVEAFRKYYGPTMNAFKAAEKNVRAADLQKELEVLFNSKSQS